MGRLGRLLVGLAVLVTLVCWAAGLFGRPLPPPSWVVLAGLVGAFIGFNLGHTAPVTRPDPTLAARGPAVAAEIDVPIQPASHTLETVEGIGRGYGKRLRDLGIPDTLALLEFGTCSARRAELASQLKIEPLVVQRWTSMADLLRVPNLDAQSAEVLEAAGVSTMAKLAECGAVALVGRLFEVNERLRLTPGDLPSVEQMERWIGLAGFLPTVIDEL